MNICILKKAQDVEVGETLRTKVYRIKHFVERKEITKDGKIRLRNDTNFSYRCYWPEELVYVEKK